MSLPEKPRKLPAQYDARAVEQLIQDIYTAINGGFSFVRLQSLAAEPEKVVPHMVVIANGADWNPGSGGGIYRRNGSNTAWIFIG